MLVLSMLAMNSLALQSLTSDLDDEVDLHWVLILNSLQGLLLYLTPVWTPSETGKYTLRSCLTSCFLYFVSVFLYGPVR